jgi:hypothetical protein
MLHSVNRQLDFWTNVGGDMVENVATKRGEPHATRSQFRGKWCDEGTVSVVVECKSTSADSVVLFYADPSTDLQS